MEGGNRLRLRGARSKIRRVKPLPKEKPDMDNADFDFVVVVPRPAVAAGFQLGADQSPHPAA